MKRSQAFTLIELILVILIISILAVSVVPKFFGASDLAHYTVRDQLISLLRLSQLKAMNQLDTCNRVVITNERMVIENNVINNGCGNEASAETRITLDGVVVKNSIGTAPTVLVPLFITFNENGISDCDCTLNIIGTETIQLKIESEGYIHVL